MKKLMVSGFILVALIAVLGNMGCTPAVQEMPPQVLIEAESFSESSGAFKVTENRDGSKVVMAQGKKGWLGYEVDVDVPGRYRCEIKLSAMSQNPGVCWVEDYYDNTDDRTYNITAAMPIPATSQGEYTVIHKDGSPLNTGRHQMRLHVESDSVLVDWIKFTLMKHHQFTQDTLRQNMQGSEWHLVWSDEFDGSGLVDSAKWTYDIGNWGWGNNEPQYYTEKRVENARQENGHLVIEARKNDLGYPWTSARLTTRGKVSFIYGKIEFRAQVPAGDGTWAAGWLLGDDYRDELSWPYCGEIDVMECVGREIDDESGNGINHASCHTRAYYFKQGNHITSTIAVENMSTAFHTYAIEWSPQAIHAFVDGQKYYTYDKQESEWAWPFNNPQNIIINLAMGGGMGGKIDESLTSQKLLVDYIRVYELR